MRLAKEVFLIVMRTLLNHSQCFNTIFRNKGKTFADVSLFGTFIIWKGVTLEWWDPPKRPEKQSLQRHAPNVKKKYESKSQGFWERYKLQGRKWTWRSEVAGMG